MPYCTLADILKRIPEEAVIQLTDDAGAGVVGQSNVDSAISRADKEIDAWCGDRYLVPFTSPAPPIVGELAIDMAIYFLYGRTVDEIPKSRADAYKNAVRLLEKISDGTISLGVEPVPAAGAVGRPVTRVPKRLFSDETLEGF